MENRVLTKSLLIVAITGLLATAVNTANSQTTTQGADSENQTKQSYCRIPNLTADQQKKMDDLRTKHLKEVTPLHNELNEKQAHLQTLMSSEKQDIEAINKQIDEIASIKAKLMKKRVAHRAEVSQILTDEQKVYFNNNAGRGGRGYGMGRGMGRGMGKGRGGMHRMQRGLGFRNCPMSN